MPWALRPSEMREESSNPNPKGIRPSEMLDVLHKVKWPTENKT